MTAGNYPFRSISPGGTLNPVSEQATAAAFGANQAAQLGQFAQGVVAVSDMLGEEAIRSAERVRRIIVQDAVNKYEVEANKILALAAQKKLGEAVNLTPSAQQQLEKAREAIGNQIKGDMGRQLFNMNAADIDSSIIRNIQQHEISERTAYGKVTQESTIGLEIAGGYKDVGDEQAYAERKERLQQAVIDRYGDEVPEGALELLMQQKLEELADSSLIQTTNPDLKERFYEQHRDEFSENVKASSDREFEQARKERVLVNFNIKVKDIKTFDDLNNAFEEVKAGADGSKLSSYDIAALMITSLQNNAVATGSVDLITDDDIMNKKLPSLGIALSDIGTADQIINSTVDSISREQEVEGEKAKRDRLAKESEHLKAVISEIKEAKATNNVPALEAVRTRLDGMTNEEKKDYYGAEYGDAFAALASAERISDPETLFWLRHEASLGNLSVQKITDYARSGLLSWDDGAGLFADQIQRFGDEYTRAYNNIFNTIKAHYGLDASTMGGNMPAIATGVMTSAFYSMRNAMQTKEYAEMPDEKKYEYLVRSAQREIGSQYPEENINLEEIVPRKEIKILPLDATVEEYESADPIVQQSLDRAIKNVVNEDLKSHILMKKAEERANLEREKTEKEIETNLRMLTPDDRQEFIRKNKNIFNMTLLSDKDGKMMAMAAVEPWMNIDEAKAAINAGQLPVLYKSKAEIISAFLDNPTGYEFRTSGNVDVINREILSLSEEKRRELFEGKVAEGKLSRRPVRYGSGPFIIEYKTIGYGRYDERYTLPDPEGEAKADEYKKQQDRERAIRKFERERKQWEKQTGLISVTRAQPEAANE